MAIGTLLAKVAEPDHLKAEVKVAEGNARELHRGLPVRFEAPTGPFRGAIRADRSHRRRWERQAHGHPRRPPPPGARADQTATGFVEIDTLHDVLFVNRPAGARDGETVPLFRLEPDGVHARRTSVALGRGSARQIEVQKGLAVGDTLIVSDTSTWEASDRIQLK